ncbi:MAG TPA: MFS transporter [Rhizomicrobium sp.]|nr:MFS transporter [Rhizomicrobium sp.]
MAFFRNRTVNLLNLHYGIHSIALTGGGAFFSAYLMRAGVPVHLVLVSLAAIFAGRLVIRPVVVPLCVRFGVRALVIVGTCMSAMQYPLLAFVHGVGPALFALCAMSSAGDTVYWSTYHAYFAALGEGEHRGHHVGAREAIAAMVGIISPLLTGFALVRFGPAVAFGVTGFVLVLGALPLFWTPDVRVAPQSPGAFRASLPGIKLFLCDGWIVGTGYFVWQLALFLSLGENFLHFGGALALAALVGAIAGMFLGRTIDSGHGTRMTAIALGSYACLIMLRAAALRDPWFAVAANALASVGSCLYAPTLMTAVYNQAQRSPCTLRFHVATEGGWDVGCASGLMIAALLVWQRTPFPLVLLLPLIGLSFAFALLRDYYARLGGGNSQPVTA